MDYVTDQSLVFFGSGPVAAQSLELLAKNFQIEAVVTKQKPAHHRGDFPVITVAEKLGIESFFAGTKTEVSELFTSKPFKSQLGIVIDYGVIIDQVVISYFPYGIINSHFSLLPEWRGADPISFAILSGQPVTGVSIMLISAGLDEGPLIALGEQPITPEDTTPSLTHKLIFLSDALLKDSIPKYLSGESKGVDQQKTAELIGRPTEPTYSRKLTKQDGQIDWNKPAEQIEREVRAYIEWPRSYTNLAGKDVIITKAHSSASQDSSAKPGDYSVIKETGTLMIACKDSALCIDSLKPAGKKDMSAKDFLLGYGKDL
jgi:methionyl-tRNA formyltransferase